MMRQFIFTICAIVIFFLTAQASQAENAIVEAFGGANTTLAGVSDEKVLSAIQQAIEVANINSVETIKLWESFGEIAVSIESPSKVLNFFCDFHNGSSIAHCLPVDQLGDLGAPVVISYASILSALGSQAGMWSSVIFYSKIAVVGLIVAYVIKKGFIRYHTGSWWSPEPNTHSHFYMNPEQMDQSIQRARDNISQTVAAMADDLETDLLKFTGVLAQVATCDVPGHTHEGHDHSHTHIDHNHSHEGHTHQGVFISQMREQARLQILSARAKGESAFACDPQTTVVAKEAKRILVEEHLKFSQKLRQEFDREVAGRLKRLVNNTGKLKDPFHRRQIYTSIEFNTKRVMAERGRIAGGISLGVGVVITVVAELIERRTGHLYCHISAKIGAGIVASGYGTYFCAKNLLKIKDLSLRERFQVFGQFVRVGFMAAFPSFQTEQRLEKLSNAERQILALSNLLKEAEVAIKATRNLEKISRAQMRSHASTTGHLKRDLNHLSLQVMSAQKQGVDVYEAHGQVFLEWLERLQSVMDALETESDRTRVQCLSLFAA